MVKKVKTENKIYMTDVEHRVIDKAIPITEENTQNYDDVEELFGNDSNTSESQILKELFNQKNFKVKSELSKDEISIISRIYTLAKLTNRPHLTEVVNEFIILRISKDRQSRKEFVEANREMKKDMNNGLFNKMFGGNV